jgi:uncharacterized protein YndB with AHSA1/START domain
MTTITADRDAIIEEIEIAAPPERVFAAISDPARLTQWWQEEGASRIEYWKWDLVKGSKWNARWTGMKGEVYVLSGEIVEIDPPRLLAYTWEATWLGHPTSVVRWALTANSRRNARKGHAQRPARASGGDR